MLTFKLPAIFLYDLIGLIPAFILVCLFDPYLVLLVTLGASFCAALPCDVCWMVWERLFWTTRNEVNWNSEGVFLTLLMIF